MPEEVTVSSHLLEHKSLSVPLSDLKTMGLKPLSTEFIGVSQWNWNCYNPADTLTHLGTTQLSAGLASSTFDI